jgi:hypothetical protein
MGRDHGIGNYVDLGPRDDSFAEYWNGTIVNHHNGHTGHDVAVVSFGEQFGGFPIFAALDGEIVDYRDGNDDTCPELCGSANNIAIDHGNGRICYYTHFVKNSINFHTGDFVKAGDHLGDLGSSGNSTGPHLHWETVDYGVVIEPLSGAGRCGASDFVDQSFLVSGLMVGDMGIASDTAFSTWQNHPYELPRSGYLLQSDTKFWHWMIIHNANQTNMSVEYSFRRPDNTMSPLTFNANLGNAPARAPEQCLEVPEMQTLPGLWHVLIDINNGERLIEAPVVVVATPAEQINRPPAPISIALSPPNPTENDVVRCSLTSDPLLDDPDYDLLRFEYVWTAEDPFSKATIPIRTDTTAASSDVIPHHKVPAGWVLRCEVTAMDDEFSGSMEFIEVVMDAGTGACLQSGGAVCSIETCADCQLLGGEYLGDGTSCAGDWDLDGLDDISGDGAVVVCVDADATGANDGRSWVDAFTSLDDALCLGTELGSKGVSIQVWIAEGIYRPSRSDQREIPVMLSDPCGPVISADTRTSAFGLRNNVALLGGFTGDELAASERDPMLHETVLSGDIGVPGDNADNCYHVLIGSGCDRTAIIDGCVIEGGNTTGNGAGLFIRGGRPLIRDCVFRNNEANIGGAYAGFVARFGIFRSHPRFERCAFIHNSSNQHGGAVSLENTYADIVGCLFVENDSSGVGGAAYANGESAAAFTNCSFVDNPSMFAGDAVYARHTANITIDNSIVWSNPTSPLFAVDTKTETAVIDVHNSIVEGGWSGGTNIIDADPEFVDAAGSDYRLSAGSPAIDAGDNGALGLIGITEDLAGEDRFIDDPNTVDNPNGVAPIVDIGAYEFVPVCEGDANGDGAVDVNDISYVLFRLGDSGTPGTVDGDANGDGVVDVNDISYVLFRLGDSCL